MLLGTQRLLAKVGVLGLFSKVKLTFIFSVQNSLLLRFFS